MSEPEPTEGDVCKCEQCAEIGMVKSALGAAFTRALDGVVYCTRCACDPGVPIDRTYDVTVLKRGARV